MEYVWIPVCLLMGALAAQNPEAVWEWQHFLTVKNGEPTKLALRLIRFGGMLAMACSAGMLVYLVCK